MSFDPKPTKYPFPMDTAAHYLVVKKNDGTIFDAKYPYLDKSKSFKFKRFLVRILLILIVFPMNRIKMGLRIKGKKNIRKNKKLFKQGVISCSNHINMWDYIGVMSAIKPFKPYTIVWAPNVSGESGKLVRLVNGIPIPEGDLSASYAFNKAIVELLKNKKWLHVYPEGSMWEYYAQIRPFKKGAAHFAAKYDLPVLPMGYSYREAGWLRKKVFHQPAKLTLSIGEPLFINKDLPFEEQEIDLIKRMHKAVCELAKVENNLYEPIYNNSKRIDYYTTEYGVEKRG